MVAFNYQTMDTSSLMNFGLFNHINGGAGYVLKPPSVLGDGSSPGPAEMTVLVHSGYRLPKPNHETKGEIVDAFVSLTLDCADEDVQHYETRVINDNGFNPEWKATFKFQVRNWDIAILIIEVYDQDLLTQEFLCGNACRVCQLERKGYRWVPLVDSRFEVVPFSGLLIHISCEDAKPTSCGAQTGPAKEDTTTMALGLKEKSMAPQMTCKTVKRDGSCKVSL